MKPKPQLDRSGSVDSNGSISSTPSKHSSFHRYNLRSQGPPRYVQFSDMECPICLEEYNAPVIVNCGHSFCSICIKKCISTIPACPICKEALVPRLFIYNVDYTKRIAAKEPESTPKRFHSPQCHPKHDSVV